MQTHTRIAEYHELHSLEEDGGRIPRLRRFEVSQLLFAMIMPDCRCPTVTEARVLVGRPGRLRSAQLRQSWEQQTGAPRERVSGAPDKARTMRNPTVEIIFLEGVVRISPCAAIGLHTRTHLQEGDSLVTERNSTRKEQYHAILGHYLPDHRLGGGDGWP